MSRTAVALAAVLSAALPGVAAERPNVVLIFTDG